VLSEESTIAEFDMLREARIMEMAQAMLGDTWRDSWMDWANRLDLTAFPQLTSMQRQGEARPGMLDELMRCHGPHVRAPTGEWMSQHTPGQRATSVLVKHGISAREKRRAREQKGSGKVEKRAHE
jgi:hypothetical protein